MRHTKLIDERIFLEVRKVKKISLILMLTLVMVVAFAAVALASGPHGGYGPNTDACKSCHSVHNTADKDFLLSVEGKTETTEVCLACHDGTGSSINVKTGKQTVLNQTVDTHGGPFAVMNGGTASASEHSVASSLNVNSAPGGKGSSGSDNYGSWNEDFTCGSCHEPHGNGGNPRLLNPNPNGVMKAIVGVKLGDYTDQNGTTTFLFTNGVTTADTFTDYNSNGVNDVGTDAALTDISIKKKPVLTTSIKVFVGGTQAANSTYEMGINGDGNAYVKFTSAPGTTGAVTVNYTPILEVFMTWQPTAPGQQEQIQYGPGMEQFCAACHTDYQGKRSSSTAVYDTETPYHHSGNRTNGNSTYSNPQLGNVSVKDVDGNTVTSTGSCLTCHYAHGVDQPVWASKGTVYNVPESEGSSYLKRLPNMGVCEVCHRWELKGYSPNNQFIISGGAYKLITD